MKKVSYYYDNHFKIGDVNENLYSSFIEHLGRAVYSGIYEPGHEKADEDGFRTDAMEVIKDLKLGLVRYPGGNFVSNYDWKDGIGPKENRPKRMEFAWSSVETNQFGIDDFCRWAKKAGIEPMIAVNLGTGSVKSAAELVEYCNHPGGTYWSDLRIKNGSKEPYNIKYWCLGNEMEGTWQAGHLSAEDYAKKACEAAKLMKWVDKDIKLVACGSSYEMLPTYMDWDRIVLKELYPYVDYISTHNYNMNTNQGTSNFLASYKQLDDHIKNTERVLDYVKAKNKEEKDIKICLDEWNVWNFQDIKLDSLDDLQGLTTFEVTSAEKWEEAPAILEEKYSLLDALTVGGLAITLINNADRVKIACLAQLINVIAPITTQRNGGVLKQSTYYPFSMVSNYGRGTVLKPSVNGASYKCDFGELPLVEAATVYDKESDEIRVFALNCNQDEDTELDLQFNGFGDRKISKQFVLSGDDLELRNTFESPDNVTVKEKDLSNCDGTKVVLPKLSWNVLIIK
ncbi:MULTISPECIES: alpha-N-arabinofuranosidase [Clostridium]|uniref:non-reducing end alpha-L-arabinofuranosidase n=5 Tax=Clostridium TaxID=1485 RepID=D8GKA0_CLOLD|nr:MULTISPECIES: alpha-N-arabinofuranosidase [Clostridium]ADK13218.1 alpha-L-arabinofuranosidase [Clostridium ljungdahlii DSM 13528]AGY76444.1 alpha-N-arabinofuranosidase [Clostridium autoethanogenum DSM 10061]ALU36606.1 Alpha-L-arabinofuranosidase domain protein [Clostridium autoethanogenum DSM 10061]OAA83415.1 Intracellular exo-alpha-(1->5)-L-arabinofuranosidase [Clostridium ljungdahlii DSM 13528]OAA85073.1 Intracellular exo-alpha-(1->5)-L-arabinofuranosidase [Clostridium coskatii]